MNLLPNGIVPLDGAHVRGGGHLTARLQMSAPAPRNVSISLFAGNGLALPGQVGVGQGSVGSGDLPITAAEFAGGVRSVTAVLNGVQTVANVIIDPIKGAGGFKEKEKEQGEKFVNLEKITKESSLENFQPFVPPAGPGDPFVQPQRIPGQL